MKAIAILAMLSLGSNALAQSPKETEPLRVERLCGKLEHQQNSRTNGAAEFRNLSHIPLNLYPAKEDSPCCRGISAVASTKTGRWGSFEFKSKSLPAGMYWLETEANGRQYQMLIHYVPERNPEQLCSTTLWAIDDGGNFRQVLQVTLD